MKIDVNDIVGKKFGELTVLNFSHRSQNRIYYQCECQCGNKTFVRRDSLLSGQTQSCGCLVYTTNKRKKLSPNDIVGKKFNRWTVLSFHHKCNDKYYYLCKCDCGVQKIILRRSLIEGTSKSCGCLKIEIAAKVNLKHHLYLHPLHSVWRNMKQRCYNPNNKKYSIYGAKGITVCEEWKNDFESFYKWSIDNGYKPGLSIDRINNNKNYEPSNCRWGDIIVQNRNTSRNHYIEYNEESHCISEWAEILKINRNTLNAKIIKGYTINDIINAIPQY